MNMKIEYLENKAHEHAFTDLGTFYWELFLIEEYNYNQKNYNKYVRKY